MVPQMCADEVHRAVSEKVVGVAFAERAWGRMLEEPVTPSLSPQ